MRKSYLRCAFASWRTRAGRTGATWLGRVQLERRGAPVGLWKNRMNMVSKKLPAAMIGLSTIAWIPLSVSPCPFAIHHSYPLPVAHH